jgi:hypothetical protein
MHRKTIKFTQCKWKHLYLKFVEVFLHGGNSGGESLVLLSIARTSAFSLSICIDLHFSNKVHRWGTKRGREREVDTMSDRVRVSEG